MDYSKQIKAHLKKLGKPLTIDDGALHLTADAVVEQTWRKNKSRFEEISSKAGRYYKDYYNYIGPYDIDIKTLSDEAVVTVLGESFYFVQKERVTVGGVVQYYRGILKRAEEGDTNVFTYGS